MSSLLIFLSEQKPFDKDEVIKAISAMDGVTNAKEGKFIGAVFECAYTNNGNSTIVRLSESLKSISAESLRDESLDFALKLKDVFPQPLSVVDTDDNRGHTDNRLNRGQTTISLILSKNFI